MKEKINGLRKILSINIKKHRELLGLSQEKLAEIAGISSMMMKDIEGCRTWVSEKTLINLASALKTDSYRLLMPETMYENELYRTVLTDLEKTAQKIKEDVETNINKALKLWGKKGKETKKEDL